ncbi:alpha/beta hydrolase [Corynebacterium sp. L4756]|uniref:alpha/beta hydrolase n=1 Tax=unclassified Corynebacterium TaxID=2624378 RepID=UPI00374CF313
MRYVHPEAQAFLDATSQAVPLDLLSPDENWANQLKGSADWGAKIKLASVPDTTIAGVEVRVYVPIDVELEPGSTAGPAFIYFHGGGWVLGDLDTNDSTVRDIADGTGMICISVHYRRAPENPFPAPLEDCLAVVDEVLAGESGLQIDPNLVAIGGDSAGGNIAAEIAQERREQIVHQVLIYPVLNLSTFDTASHDEFADGYFLTRRRLTYFYDSYAGGHDRSNVRMSPGLNDQLTGLPPATIITAECDPLVSEVSDYAERMLKAGNTVSAIEFKGQVHPFLQMGGAISDAQVARRMISAELRHALKEKK